MDNQCCPTCGQSIRPVPVETRVAELEAACRAHGFLVTPDGRVREDTAAALLGLAAGTLRNWSYGERQLPFVRVARRRTYRLVDLAAFMARE